MVIGERDHFFGPCKGTDNLTLLNVNTVSTLHNRCI